MISSLAIDKIYAQLAEQSVNFLGAPQNITAHKSYQLLSYCAPMIGIGSVIDKGDSYHTASTSEE
jgi:hypothetical protein